MLRDERDIPGKRTLSESCRQVRGSGNDSTGLTRELQAERASASVCPAGLPPDSGASSGRIVMRQ